MVKKRERRSTAEPRRLSIVSYDESADRRRSSTFGSKSSTPPPTLGERLGTLLYATVVFTTLKYENFSQLVSMRKGGCYSNLLRIAEVNKDTKVVSLSYAPTFLEVEPQLQHVAIHPDFYEIEDGIPTSACTLRLEIQDLPERDEDRDTISRDLEAAFRNHGYVEAEAVPARLDAMTPAELVTTADQLCEHAQKASKKNSALDNIMELSKYLTQLLDDSSHTSSWQIKVTARKLRNEMKKFPKALAAHFKGYTSQMLQLLDAVGQTLKKFPDDLKSSAHCYPWKGRLERDAPPADWSSRRGARLKHSVYEFFFNMSQPAIDRYMAVARLPPSAAFRITRTQTMDAEFVEQQDKRTEEDSTTTAVELLDLYEQPVSAVSSGPEMRLPLSPPAGDEGDSCTDDPTIEEDVDEQVPEIPSASSADERRRSSIDLDSPPAPPTDQPSVASDQMNREPEEAHEKVDKQVASFPPPHRSTSILREEPTPLAFKPHTFTLYFRRPAAEGEKPSGGREEGAVGDDERMSRSAKCKKDEEDYGGSPSSIKKKKKKKKTTTTATTGLKKKKRRTAAAAECQE